jgi:hypothetical protein
MRPFASFPRQFCNECGWTWTKCSSEPIRPSGSSNPSCSIATRIVLDAHSLQYRLLFALYSIRLVEFAAPTASQLYCYSFCMHRKSKYPILQCIYGLGFIDVRLRISVLVAFSPLLTLLNCYCFSLSLCPPPSLWVCFFNINTSNSGRA